MDATASLSSREIVRRLKDAGYIAVKVVSPQRWVGLRVMLNGWAICRGDTKLVEPDVYFYNGGYERVKAVFDAWNGVGQPENFMGKFKLKSREYSWDHSVKR